MSKSGYYGVYGKNAAGVFTNYDRVLSCQKYILGMKIKKFMNMDEATEFIVELLTEALALKALCEEYSVISLKELNVELLYEKINWIYYLTDLRKHKIITETVIKSHISGEFL